MFQPYQQPIKGMAMSLKSIIENSPSIIVLGCLFTGFMSGVGAMEYLDSREEALRNELLAQIKAENSKLKASNEELDSAVKELVIKHISAQQDIVAGIGKNNEIRKVIENIDSHELSKAIKDPKKDISQSLGIKW